MRKRRVVCVSVSSNIADTLKKLRENNMNISRVIESAVREYIGKMLSAGSTSAPLLDPGKYVVIERSTYFNNVCSDLLKTYNEDEVFRLEIGMVYVNALSLMYKICSQAFMQ